MNNALVAQAAAGFAVSRQRELPSNGEVTVEELSRAVGQNALLQTEISRQMALRIVEMREELRLAEKELKSLREEFDGLISGVTHAFALMANQPARSPQTHGSAPSNVAKPDLCPRLVAPEKLLKMGPHLRLNVGCGSKPLSGYFNIDERELEGVDLIADVRALPFRPGSVSEIHAAHLIEHFTETALRSEVLPAWRRLLKPSGVLTIAVPDADGMIQAFSRGQFPFESLRAVTFGGQDYPGNFHYTMFSRDSLRAILCEAGFTAGEYEALARTNGQCLEMEIKAVKKA